jgi:hypothetical protein
VPGWSSGHITLAVAARPCLAAATAGSQNHQNQVAGAHLDGQ